MEPEFRQLLRMGYQAQVLCVGDAYYKAAVWYGEWTVRVVSDDGRVSKTLVVFPRRAGEVQEIKIKVFRTINGCASFMHRMGFADFTVPFFEGGQSNHTLPVESEDTSDSEPPASLPDCLGPAVIHQPCAGRMLGAASGAAGKPSVANQLRRLQSQHQMSRPPSWVHRQRGKSCLWR